MQVWLKCVDTVRDEGRDDVESCSGLVRAAVAAMLCLWAGALGQQARYIYLKEMRHYAVIASRM